MSCSQTPDRHISNKSLTLCIYIDTRDKCLRMLLVRIQIKPKTASYYIVNIFALTFALTRKEF
jgi:hypothetical protein